MPHNILTSEEKKLYGITVKMLPLVWLSTLMIGGKVVFVVNLPIETKEVYFAAMIIPFPNKRHEKVDFNEQKVLISGEDVFEWPEKLTKNRNLKPLGELCLRNAFKSQNRCRMNLNEEQSVHEVGDGIIVVKIMSRTSL